MRVIFLGDVVGAYGCELLEKRLRALKRQYQADIAVVNGENSAEGNGILPSSARQIFDSGADVITGGNHSLRRREIYRVLEEEKGVLRPANYHVSAPGSGIFVLDMLKYRFAVVNLQGVAYMDHHENPFDCIDRILPKLGTKNILVDFHAEATAEKLSMGFYLDGRVSAVLGTHTHVQTADERILPNGTAYITDAGMCGSYDSVLGVKKELAVHKMRTGLPTRFENERRAGVIWGVIIEIDEATGKAVSIARIADFAQ